MEHSPLDQDLSIPTVIAGLVAILLVFAGTQALRNLKEDKAVRRIRDSNPP